MRYLYLVLAWTTKNEPQMPLNLKPKNLKSGFYLHKFMYVG